MTNIVSEGAKMNADKEFIEIPVTTDIPMLRDQTVYKFYIIRRKEDRCSNDEIRAVSKLCNVNYIAAKNMLEDKTVFIAEGNAYRMKELQQLVSAYEVIYEINPPYQY
jgi:hypothetical protein